MPPSTSFADTVELLRRAKAGEPECLGRVLERYRERLLVRVRCMMGAEARRIAESDDFLQGVFIKVLEHFDRFELRDERSFLRWTAQIARNRIRDDVCKKRERALESFASESGLWPAACGCEDTPDRVAARAEQIAQLVEALEELDEDQHRALELRHFEQLPFAEIGRRLDRSANAAQLLHTRALLRLGQLLPRRASRG